MKLIITIFLGVTSCFLFGNNDPIILAEAKVLIAQGEYTNALSKLEKVEDPRGYYFQGWCHFKLGNCHQAVPLFERFEATYNGQDKEIWFIESASNRSKCKGKTRTIVQQDLKFRDEEKTVRVNTLPANAAEEKYRIRKIQIEFDQLRPKKEFIELDDFELITFIENREKFPEDISINQLAGNIQQWIDIYNADSRLDEITYDKGELVSTSRSNGNSNLVTKETKENNNPVNPTFKEPRLSATKKEKSEIESDKPTLEKQQEDSKELVFNSKDKRPHYKVLFEIKDNPDQQYISLMNLGPVYTEKLSDNRYGYYIGQYRDKDKALKIQQRLKKSGYDLARILEFEKGELKKEEVQPVKDKDIIATYRIIYYGLKTPKDKYKALAAIGVVRTEKPTEDERAVYRYTIGNTMEKQHAEKMLAEVQKVGFSTAAIAIYHNDKFYKKL